MKNRAPSAVNWTIHAHELLNLPAPAKLNLFLHVTGRRDDGYHLLETLFELVDLTDRIDLRLRADQTIRLTDPIGNRDAETDLTVRAARLLAAYAREQAIEGSGACAGPPAGVDITLRKRIPEGAGLGGGSSDAATVLLGLNRLWRLGLSAHTLRSIAVRLGADVPFFLYGQRALGRGIGDALTAVRHEPAWYVVVVPPAQISTGEVFRRLDAVRSGQADPGGSLTERPKPQRIPGSSQRPDSSRERFVQSGENELESVVMTGWPVVADALRQLRDAVEAKGTDRRLARMSGSGASVFCPVPDEATASSVRQQLQRAVPGQVFAVRSLERHPLREEPFIMEPGSRAQRHRP